MTIIHVDANSAYLSWTAVALLEKGYPIDIRKVPSAIAGDPENRHGIILAKSIPAKKFQVGTGESLFESKRRCPQLLVFPPDYDLYLKCSDGMYNILQEYSPIIQRYSVDECFVDFNNDRIKENAIESIAYEIKDRIKDRLGFTVNIGIGPNKVLAKMAGELRKPDMVHTLLTQKEIEEKLWPLPIRELFMVGRSSERKLKKININTIGQLATSDKLLIESLLMSHGKLIWEYANGIDSDKVTPNDKIIQKGMGNSMTIRYDVTDIEEIKGYILALTDRVTSRLRRHGVKASIISIAIKTSGFVRYTHQIQLPFFTDDTTRTYKYACKLFYQCWKNEPIRQLGVRVWGFCNSDEHQLSVFDVEKLQEDEAMNRAVDEIRKRFGEMAIYRGTFANSDLEPLEGGVNDGNYLMMGGYKS